MGALAYVGPGTGFRAAGPTWVVVLLECAVWVGLACAAFALLSLPASVLEPEAEARRLARLWMGRFALAAVLCAAFPLGVLLLALTWMLAEVLAYPELGLRLLVACALLGALPVLACFGAPLLLVLRCAADLPRALLRPDWSPPFPCAASLPGRGA